MSDALQLGRSQCGGDVVREGRVIDVATPAVGAPEVQQETLASRSLRSLQSQRHVAALRAPAEPVHDNDRGVAGLFEPLTTECDRANRRIDEFRLPRPGGGAEQWSKTSCREGQ